LPAEAYEWIPDKVRRDIWIAPISGGTDFAGAFVGGNPLLPVYCARCNVAASALRSRPMTMPAAR